MTDMVATVSDIHELRSAFDAYNVNRVYLASLNFSDKEDYLFRAVPALLHFSIDILGCSPETPHGICFFTPQNLHIEALDHLFPDAKWKEPVNDNRPIQCLSLIGSLGTVAQSDKSDFDYIALVDKKKIPDKGIEELSNKLSAIEKWAMEELDVEVHFFLQDIVDFRENRFGSVENESIGTAGAKIMKDEFYRTAIFLGGKRPFWWITPPGMKEDEIEGFQKELPALLGEEVDNYIDLGHILYIGPQEFFGAALWQMNKFLDSPYKSLLKMALLESYLLSSKNTLLCEQLKCEILQPRKEGQCPDPYLMMSERIVEDYLKNNMPENQVRIIQAALFQKAGMDSESIKKLLGASIVNDSDKLSVIGRLLRKWNWSKNEVETYEEILSGMSKQLFLPEDLRQFFMDIYIRLSDWLKKSAITGNLISQDDLTVLGRRLFAYFEKKPGKIPLLLPGERPKKPRKCITILYDKHSVNYSKWNLYDFYLEGINSEEMRNIAKPVLRVPHLAEILVWTVVNHLWKPKAKFIFEGKSPLVKSKDIENIMAELFFFFVDGDASSPCRDDYLSQKKNIKACVIPNIDMSKSLSKPSTVDMVILNSWGEFLLKNMDFDHAVDEISNMMISAKVSNQLFSVKAVPLARNDSNFCSEFDYFVNISVEKKKKQSSETKKKKKAKLDTFS